MSDGSRFVRPSLEQIPPADPIPRLPGSVASLGLNEGLSGPFPSALAAIEAALPSLNRYPERGSPELIAALSGRHGVPEAQVAVAAGADALIGYVCQAVLEVGDEVVVPWPSFPSFVRDPQKRAAVPVLVPLEDDMVDLAAVRAAVTPRTRLVFIATPNNPTGRTVPRETLIAFVQDLPEHVLPVIDEAYFDYLDPADRLDAVSDLVCAGHDALALRTFSKLYGLAGLRVGFGVGPAAVVAAMRKVQRGYDVSTPAQVAALASLDDEAEVATETCGESRCDRVPHGPSPRPRPRAASRDRDELRPRRRRAATPTRSRQHSSRAGVSVQSGTPFGAPTSLRIGAGSPADLALLAAALATAGFAATGFSAR